MRSSSAWFGDLKDGVHKGDAEDERIALIQVVPEEIRYWHATKGKLGTAVEAGLDAMTGGVTVPGELRTITSDEVRLTFRKHYHCHLLTPSSFQN